MTRRKKSSSLKIDVLDIPDNKNIGKLFLIYKLLFLDQAKSSSDPSEILILRFPIPRASLPTSPSLSNLTLANWNPSSTQSSSCSSPVSLFFPTPFNHMLPQVLDIPNHTRSLAIINLYSDHNTLNSWIFKSHFCFKLRQHCHQQLYF